MSLPKELLTNKVIFKNEYALDILNKEYTYRFSQVFFNENKDIALVTPTSADKADRIYILSMTDKGYEHNATIVNNEGNGKFKTILTACMNKTGSFIQAVMIDSKDTYTLVTYEYQKGIWSLSKESILDIPPLNDNYSHMCNDGSGNTTVLYIYDSKTSLHIFNIYNKEHMLEYSSIGKDSSFRVGSYSPIRITGDGSLITILKNYNDPISNSKYSKLELWSNLKDKWSIKNTIGRDGEVFSHGYDVSPNGDLIAIANHYEDDHKGCVYVFQKTENEYSQIYKFNDHESKPRDRFGWLVMLDKYKVLEIYNCPLTTDNSRSSKYLYSLAS